MTGVIGFRDSLLAQFDSYMVSNAKCYEIVITTFLFKKSCYFLWNSNLNPVHDETLDNSPSNFPYLLSELDITLSNPRFY